jgi:hypothetical protein
MHGTITDLHRARRICDLSRQLELVARQLAEHCLTVELALVRRDWETVHETADTVGELSVRFKTLRRQILAVGAPTRT